MYIHTWYYVCMPKVTIWIRVEDEQKWNSIPDKPKWLHQNLNTINHALGNPNRPKTPDTAPYDRLGTDSHPSTSARIVQSEPRVEPDEGSV